MGSSAFWQVGDDFVLINGGYLPLYYLLGFIFMILTSLFNQRGYFFGIEQEGSFASFLKKF